MVRVDLGRVGGARKRRPQPRRDDVGGQRSERMGDRFRVAGRPKDAVDATRGDRGEEVLEVQPDDDEPSGVLACVAADRPAAREAVRCVVCGDPVENVVQDPSVDRLEPALRPLDHPHRPTWPAQRRVPVVAKPLLLDRALERACVREPRKLSVADTKEAGQGADRRDLGHRPPSPPHRRLRQQPSTDCRRLPADRLALLHGEGDEPCELARRVRRRTVVRREHLARNRPNPPRTRI